MLEKLTEYFLKFPGIGQRQAKRFAFFLAGQNKNFLKEFADAVLETKERIKQCDSCYRFFEGNQYNTCNICSSPNRNKNLLMVVEKDVDLENIEKSGVFNGKYFILGGVLPLTNGKNPPDGGLRLKELFEKVKKNSPAGEPQEIIIATSATIEGENTSRYIEKILEPLQQAMAKPIKITRLGRGLSTGTELEFIDSETMNNALKNRK